MKQIKGTLRGFTLVEVLIASVILFSTLTVFTVILRTALISNERAIEVVEKSVATIMILDDIQVALFESSSVGKANGEGSFIGSAYRWKASVKESARPPPRYLGQQLVQAEHEIKLWTVELEMLTENSKNIKNFTYDEATW
jgi:hypothetical protein